MSKDYGVFGKGSTGYAHYTQAHNRYHNKGGGGGRPPSGGSGCLGMLALIVIPASTVVATLLQILK